MASKAEMLSRVREALGASPATASEYPEPKTYLGPETDQAVLVKQFQVELERVGGRFTAVNSIQDIEDYLKGLVPAGGHPIVAVSDGVAASEPDLRPWLASRGAKLIPSLREFTSAHSNGSPLSDTPVDLAEQYKRALFESSLGITCADYAIADTGTVVIASKTRPAEDDSAPGGRKSKGPRPVLAEQHRLISLVPPVHVCLLQASSIVGSLKEFFPLVNRELYPAGAPPLVMTFITGPSRTADIELSLTMGVHGPRELHVLVYGS
jgi:L-lactate dehydrogenase complex protein LldG